MSDHPTKKPYTTPQVYQVDLDHEQAILTVVQPPRHEPDGWRNGRDLSGGDM